MLHSRRCSTNNRATGVDLFPTGQAPMFITERNKPLTFEELRTQGFEAKREKQKSVWTAARVDRFKQLLHRMHQDKNDWHRHYSDTPPQPDEFSIYVAQHVFNSDVTAEQVQKFLPRVVFEWCEESSVQQLPVALPTTHHANDVDDTGKLLDAEQHLQPRRSARLRE
jgi:hypothetical protein